MGELEISRVGGEQTSGGAVGGTQADLRVDVEHARSATWGPDDRGAVGLIVLEVITSQGANEVVLSARLFDCQLCIQMSSLGKQT